VEFLICSSLTNPQGIAALAALRPMRCRRLIWPSETCNPNRSCNSVPMIFWLSLQKLLSSMTTATAFGPKRPRGTMRWRLPAAAASVLWASQPVNLIFSGSRSDRWNLSDLLLVGVLGSSAQCGRHCTQSDGDARFGRNLPWELADVAASDARIAHPASLSLSISRRGLHRLLPKPIA
jgi:hypothetical protein